MAHVPQDVVLLFIARGLRMFGYGTTGFLLALYLNCLGLSDIRIGTLLYITMLGDAAISLLVTMFADRVGRRVMLLLGCFLKLLGGATLASVSGPHFWLLAFGCTIGVISPSGNEVGPFLAVEQAALSDLVHPQSRTMVFAWHSFLGACTSALGSLFAGFFTSWLVQHYAMTVLHSYRTIFIQYGAIAVMLMVLVGALSSRVDWPARRSVQVLQIQDGREDTYLLSQPLCHSSSSDDVSLRMIGPPAALSPTGCTVHAAPADTRDPTAFEGRAGCDDSDGLPRRTTSMPPLGARQHPACHVQEYDAEELQHVPTKLRSLDCPASKPAAADGKCDGGAAAGFVPEPALPQQAVASPRLGFVSSPAFGKSGATGAGGPPSDSDDDQDKEDENAVQLRPLRTRLASCSKPSTATTQSRPATAAQTDKPDVKTPFPQALDASSGADMEAGALPAAVTGTTVVVHGPGPKGIVGLSRESRGKVLHLCSLFLLDSFGSGMINGSLLVYWLQVTWNLPGSSLGTVLFGASLVGGFSSLASGWVASRLGLVKTMVFTHLPSSIFLMLVPMMPSAQLAVAMIFLRYSISQMDVVPRQSYVSGFVSEDERTVTLGITNIVRSLGSACSPLVTGWLASSGHFGWAFAVSGSVQIIYDLLLLWSFSHRKAEHE